MNISKFFNVVAVIMLSCLIVACEKNDQTVHSDSEKERSELLMGLFKSPVTTTDELIYTEISNLKELEAASKRIFMPADSFFNAYSKIQDASLESFGRNIKRLTYKLAEEKDYKAYTYTDAELDKGKTAYLFIPGSGVNEAGKIFYENKNDYHY